jgi:hypothetical protein
MHALTRVTASLSLVFTWPMFLMAILIDRGFEALGTLFPIACIVGQGIGLGYFEAELLLQCFEAGAGSWQFWVLVGFAVLHLTFLVELVRDQEQGGQSLLKGVWLLSQVPCLITLALSVLYMLVF